MNQNEHCFAIFNENVNVNQNTVYFDVDDITKNNNINKKLFRIIIRKYSLQFF